MTPYYEHAGIKIYHGDCREILPTLPKFDLLLTDPPYGIGYAANPIVGKGKTKGNHESMDWDGRPIVDMYELLRGVANELVIWGGNYYVLPPSRGWLTWYKPDAPPSMAHFEMGWTSRDANARQFSWSIAATNPERIGHCTQKPLALMAWCLSFFPEAQSVLDPFMGSGTTLRAAKNRGVQATGIEREEKYCEIAAKRLSQEVMAFA